MDSKAKLENYTRRLPHIEDIYILNADSQRWKEKWRECENEERVFFCSGQWLHLVIEVFKVFEVFEVFEFLMFLVFKVFVVFEVLRFLRFLRFLKFLRFLRFLRF